MSDQEHNLEDEILADARRRAERTLQRARREAERVVREAKGVAQQERERLMEMARQRTEREQRMQEARLGQELQRMRRQAFQDVLDNVRAEAERELGALPGDEEARQMLVRLAAGAIDAMHGERFLLVLRPEDRERWRNGIAEEVRSAVSSGSGRSVRVAVADEDLKATGGLLVRAQDTSEMVDQSFEARMERLWEEIRGHVADTLGSLWDEENG